MGKSSVCVCVYRGGGTGHGMKRRPNEPSMKELEWDCGVLGEGVGMAFGGGIGMRLPPKKVGPSLTVLLAASSGHTAASAALAAQRPACPLQAGSVLQFSVRLAAALLCVVAFLLPGACRMLRGLQGRGPRAALPAACVWKRGSALKGCAHCLGGPPPWRHAALMR